MFVLCYEGIRKDGKKDILPIYEDKLINIDMYTCYKSCDSKESLFKLLPEKVKQFILDNFDERKYGNLNGNFFIRKACKNIRKGKTDFKVLYNNYSDIVYSYQSEIYDALKVVKIDIQDYDNKDSYMQRSFFKELYYTLENEKRLMYLIDRNNEKINTYACNRSRICSIATTSSNLNIIANYISRANNYELKRNALLLLKKYFYNSIVIIDNDVREKREYDRKFSLSRAIMNMEKNLSNERINFKKEEVKKEEISTYKYTHEDDIEYIDDLVEYKDANEDDFLGPVKPNDPKYWSIN